MEKNIVNIFVRIFCETLQLWHLIYIQMIYMTWYFHFSNSIFNNNVILIFNVYGSTTWSLFQQMNIFVRINNSQHPMLDHPDFINNAIEKCKKEIFPSYMLEYGVYITHSLNFIYVVSYKIWYVSFSNVIVKNIGAKIAKLYVMSTWPIFQQINNILFT